MSQPTVLIINDDGRLLETRRLLLEESGAHVVTARGEANAIIEVLLNPTDLVLIDATNVGLAHGEELCTIAKLRHSNPIALLLTPEMGVPASTVADRVIYRTGPRRLLVQINEMLDGRLNVQPWESGDGNSDESASF